MSDPKWLSSSPHATLIKSLRAIAWADGVLESDEKIFLERLIQRVGLEPSGHELERFWSLGREDAFIPNESDPFSKRFILSKAMEMSFEDGSYSERERTHIERWAKQWEISAEELEEMEAEVSDEYADGFR
jgi:uncharacterized tellurite resistance protein B-like protein